MTLRCDRERTPTLKGKEAEWGMKMWVDKYRPDKFTDLLGDEVRGPFPPSLPSLCLSQVADSFVIVFCRESIGRPWLG